MRFDAGVDRLDWLVVTPDGKVAAKGTGTVNGVSGYGFVFYGYDGCVTGQTTGCQPGTDRFRVVIWPLSAGAYPVDTIVYDNRRDKGYDVDVADPQGLLSGTVTNHPAP